MNHEERINYLERKVDNLESILRASGILNEWQSVTVASRQLGISGRTIRSWINKEAEEKRPRIRAGVHYRKVGNKYQINVKKWEEFLSKTMA